MKSFATFVLTVLCVHAFGCSSSSSSDADSNQSTSCTIPQTGGKVCTEEVDIPAPVVKSYDTQCGLEKGTVAGRCPSAGLYGCCRTTNKSNSTKIDNCYYLDMMPTDTTLIDSCKNGGAVWTTTVP